MSGVACGLAGPRYYRSQSVGIHTIRLDGRRSTRHEPQITHVTVAPTRPHLLQLSPPRGHTLHPPGPWDAGRRCEARAGISLHGTLHELAVLPLSDVPHHPKPPPKRPVEVVKRMGVAMVCLATKPAAIQPEGGSGRH